MPALPLTQRSLDRDLSPQVFLDVDALGNTALRDWQHIDVSNVVLVFLTENFIKSGACSKEVMRAIFLKKPIIAVLETDAARGALSQRPSATPVSASRVAVPPTKRLGLNMEMALANKQA